VGTPSRGKMTVVMRNHKPMKPKKMTVSVLMGSAEWNLAS
jgi:hypothetical protein